MKQKISLVSSTSILIGAVIAILALLRGPAQTVLLLIEFALWGLWMVLFPNLQFGNNTTTIWSSPSCRSI